MTETVEDSSVLPAGRAQIHAALYPLREPSPCALAGLSMFRSFHYELEQPVRRLELSSGKVVLVIGMGDDISMSVPDSSEQPVRFTSFAVGPCHAPLMTEHHGIRSCIEISMPPWSACECFGSAGTLFDAHPVPLDTLLGPCVQAILGKQLSKCASWPERFALLEEFLARCIHTNSWTVRREIRWAWERLETTGGCIPVSELSRELGWSHRHFIRCFRDATGMTPKTAARQIRMARACRQLQASDGNNLCLVAARCGYSDQAHFTREFRELAGCTPADYRHHLKTTPVDIVT